MISSHTQGDSDSSDENVGCGAWIDFVLQGFLCVSGALETYRVPDNKLTVHLGMYLGHLRLHIRSLLLRH